MWKPRSKTALVTTAYVDGRVYVAAPHTVSQSVSVVGRVACSVFQVCETRGVRLSSVDNECPCSDSDAGMVSDGRQVCQRWEGKWDWAGRSAAGLK
jgi:hypothetical protein